MTRKWAYTVKAYLNWWNVCTVFCNVLWHWIRSSNGAHCWSSYRYMNSTRKAVVHPYSESVVRKPCSRQPRKLKAPIHWTSLIRLLRSSLQSNQIVKETCLNGLIVISTTKGWPHAARWDRPMLRVLNHGWNFKGNSIVIRSGWYIRDPLRKTLKIHAYNLNPVGSWPAFSLEQNTQIRFGNIKALGIISFSPINSFVNSNRNIYHY